MLLTPLTPAVKCSMRAELVRHITLCWKSIDTPESHRAAFAMQWVGHHYTVGITAPKLHFQTSVFTDGLCVEFKNAAAISVECFGIMDVLWHSVHTATVLSALRRDTQTELPIVQVQICRYITYDDAWEDMDYWWTLTRENQRLLGTVIPKLDTVSAIAAQTLDGIHICSADQRRVAKNAAESMLHLKGYSNMLAAPALDFIRINQNDNTIQVAFKNLHGALQAQGIPWGFSFSRSEHILTNRPPYRTVLQGNSAILYHDEKPETLENLYLTYAFGNTFYANITDSKERSIPGFGPIPLRFLKQK